MASRFFPTVGERPGRPISPTTPTLPDGSQWVFQFVKIAKALVALPKVGDPKWDDISGWKPEVTLSRDGVELLHVGLDDLSMAKVNDLPVGLGQSPTVHMPHVLRAFFVFEPEDGVNEIDLTCELRDRDGKVVSEKWVYLWRR